MSNSILHRRFISLSLWLASVAILIFLVWISSTFGLFSYEPDFNPSYYAMLSDAFLNGQLNLLIQPPADISNSFNPYDPYQRGDPYGYVWDASLYKGEYFLYFGAVPALLFYLPCKVLFGFYPTDNAVIAILSVATIVALLITCLQVAKKLLSTRAPLHPGIWLLFIASASSLTLQLGGAVWVVAALSGMFFQVLALLALLKTCSPATTEGTLKNPRLWALLAGCAAAGAIGSRPTHFLLIPTAIALIVGAQFYAHSLKSVAKILVAFLLPVGLGCALIGWYNYARFDEILEFGQRYQLGVADFANTPLCSLQRAVKNPTLVAIQAWYLLLQPMYLSAEYPFLNFEPIKANLLSLKYPDYLGTDPITGLLFVSPLLAPGLLAAAVVARRSSSITRLYFGSTLLIGVVMLAHLHTCIFAAARFLFEIISILLIITLPSLWSMCLSDSELSSERLRRPLAVGIWRIVTCIGVIAGLCIGVAGSLGGHFKKERDTLPFFQDLFGLPSLSLPDSTPVPFRE